MLPFIAALTPLLGKVIDKAIPDTATAEKAKAEITQQLVSNASEIEKAAASVVLAEVQGESWLQRNWRPMLMVFFAGVIGADWFGFRPDYMTDATMQEIYELLKIGIGGYVISRGAEKGIKVWKEKSGN